MEERLLPQRDISIIRERFPNDVDFKIALEKVEAGEPLAYVVGEWYFYGLTFKLNRDCLIPRPDTEHVVEKAAELIPPGGSFIDLCSGSGCIAISVLSTRKDCVGVAVEISDGAFEALTENAELNGVSERLNAVKADVFEYLPVDKYDCVISNPPYIRTDVVEELDVSVRDYEPRLALDGGADGMRFYRRILTAYRERLKENGCFVFEIGYDQREDITALSCRLGYSECKVFRDYGGNDRVAVIRL